MHSRTFYKHMAARTICATGAVDQMHHGIPLFHQNFISLHLNKSTNPKEIKLNSRSLSLCHCKLENGHLKQHIKVKEQQ